MKEANENELPGNLAQPKDQLKAELEAIERPMSLEELQEVLGSTIKKDDGNKAICFLSMLLTYTDEDQINLGFIAESSTGKSYIPLELDWYFPKEDVVELGYASPQSFFHEQGELIDDPTDHRDTDKKRKIRVIDYHKKIIIFVDQPHDQVLQRLRAYFSHDRKEITSHIVDKKERFGTRTEIAILRGPSTNIFCSANYKMADQEKTRLLLLSPEVTQEKIREAIWLRLLKEGDREAYDRMMNENQERKNLAMRVWSIKRENLKGVKIPGEMCARIGEQFLEDHKFLTGRNMRDISRLLGIIKGFAMLNHKQHVKENGYLVANEEDILVGFKLYYAVSVPNELGLSPEMWNIFTKYRDEIKKREELGVCRKDFQQWYYKTFFKTLGRPRADDILKTWETVGLITESTEHAGDKRITYYILGAMSEQNNVSSDTGTRKKVPALNDTLFMENEEAENQ